MGVRQIDRFLEQWQMDARDPHRRLILAPTPRERERWHAVWPLTQDWIASGTAQALGRDPHTIGRWAAAFGEGGPAALIFEQSGGSPALGEMQQAEMNEAVQEQSAMAGIELANWNWKVVHRFVSERFGVGLNRSRAWGLPSSVPRSGCSRRTRPNGRPSRRSTPPFGTRRGALAARYSSLTRPISGLARSCGASGC